MPTKTKSDESESKRYIEPRCWYWVKVTYTESKEKDEKLIRRNKKKQNGTKGKVRNKK